MSARRVKNQGTGDSYARVYTRGHNIKARRAHALEGSLFFPHCVGLILLALSLFLSLSPQFKRKADLGLPLHRANVAHNLKSGRCSTQQRARALDNKYLRRIDSSICGSPCALHLYYIAVQRQKEIFSVHTFIV